MNRYSMIVTLAAMLAISMPASADSDLAGVAGENVAFGFDLYQALKETDGNLLYSPYSISTALAMTYAGARGQTEREMAEVLHFLSDQDALHSSLSELQAHMNEIQERGHVQLSVANSLWCQRTFRFLDSFLDLNKKHYGAEVNLVDFINETETVRKAINSWVEDETEEKIKDLIKPGVLNTLTRLVLCNAIYFKGDWASQFEESHTRNATFHVTSEDTVQVPMMSQSEYFRWKEFDSFSAIELPYEGDDLSMIILLPDDVDGLAQLESRLDQDSVAAWIRELGDAGTAKVFLQLPRFNTTCEFDLAETLAEMGMPSAFESADFSGMTGSRDLFIGNVIHKAFIDVNEEGTEAAAATAVTFIAGGVMVRRFNVNHPFIFMIKENATESVLFVGRIVDPTS